MRLRILAVILLLAAATLVMLTGCGTAASDDMDDAESDISLDEMVALLTSGTDVPPYEIVPLDKTNFEYFTFAPYHNGLQAVAADALVNITPHSLVVIHCEDGNAYELADTIIANADPNKWLCVGSEIVNVANTDHYVVLVMSFKDLAEDIMANFEAFSLSADDGTMVLQSWENDIRASAYPDFLEDGSDTYIWGAAS